MTIFWVDDAGKMAKATDDSQDLSPLIPITDPPESGKQQWNGSAWIWPEDVSYERLRKKRNQLLHDSDWWVSSDLSITDAQTAYRQALRDLPANTPDPANIIWPTEPSKED